MISLSVQVKLGACLISWKFVTWQSSPDTSYASVFLSSGLEKRKKAPLQIQPTCLLNIQ